ncbi:Major facilitator superfamily transporter [Acididesulfobacillus acetoxydans]|uniref:Major facilitator superfamily transporter n=2 Tax=Acididesulfobacillus acetoxydans TaxID=1561005 RepID=A0A8S0WMW0_9FIRM|nr:Major facilitator superfamily transporter [Acididesulfobacillus acetoxydans]CEJ09245.1 Synaptic vesicle 2-related protein [Acididesulfobacillus acetoxydans]
MLMNISQRLDRLPVTRTLWKVLFLTGIGWLFDAMDQGMVAGVMAGIGKEWQLLPSQLGLIGSIGAVGLAIGAALAGMSADKWGRRVIIMFTLILYGVASGLTGIATSFGMLLVFRFVTGLGLGGELPAASTLVSEFSPSGARGRMVVLLESFWAWGWILASLISFLLIPIYGWRIAFFLGAVPALYTAYLRRGVPESPRFLEQTGKPAEANSIVSKMEQEAGLEPYQNTTKDSSSVTPGKATLMELWSKPLWRRTLVLWILWLGINFGYYGFVLWLPTLMIGKGFVLMKSLEFTLIMTLAQLPGYYSAAYLIEKIGRKAVLVIYLAGTAVAAYMLGQSTSISSILLYGCLLYFFSLGAWGGVYAYTPEMYPTRARGSGAGWAAAVGRIGAIAAPYVVGVMYQSYGKVKGYSYVLGMLTIAFAVVALAVGVLGIETKGRTLDEINELGV